jgi:hypothetical protein
MAYRAFEELVMGDQNDPKEEKSCFVIGPIDKEGTDIRKKADLLLGLIIKEVLGKKPFLYNVTRADSVGEPGLISVQVINGVIDSDLVVADLSGRNPNAFYELAIRHMEEKPVIHMTDELEIPFDVIDYRVIRYNMGDMAAIEKAKRELATQALAVEDKNYKVANPITKARGSRQLRSSSDTKDQMLADLIDDVSRLKAIVARLEVFSPGAPLGGPPLGGHLGISFPSGMFTTRRAEDITLGELMIPKPGGTDPRRKALVEALTKTAPKAASSNDDDGKKG